mmetsp:Transcript_16680/g.54309  ORF Transcript_16680/g.54309 Transcript_16680/m.54309 type:complete len:519 (+) Transcript_16680:52-1608(+)
MFSYEVLVEEPGPLYLRLSYEEETLRVESWDPTPHGGPGPVESMGVVRLGDALVSVNNTALRGLGFQASVLAIKQAGRPCVLHFQTHHDRQARSTDLPTTLAWSGDQARTQKGGFCWVIASTATIDERELRTLASSGLPDEGCIRPLVWRILLQYLPLERHKWCDHLTHQRKLYSQFLREFCTGETVRQEDRNSESAIAMETATTDHVPTNGGLKKSHQGCITTGKLTWCQLQLDSDLQDEIHKDVIRTHPDLQFFWEKGSCRHEVMKRILFVYAKLNPGVRYVQGMNEILGTLYFVFAMDTNDEWSSHAEADVFFCFTNLMAEMRDLFIHSLDNSDSGLNGKMSRLNDLLKDHDPELWKHLFSSQLDPSYYSLRWMTTLLAREFSLHDTIRLWDTLFAEINRSDFLCHFCVAMLRAQRQALLQGDFTFCLGLLQNYPWSDPATLLRETEILIGDQIPHWGVSSARAGSGILVPRVPDVQSAPSMITLDRFRTGPGAPYFLSWFGAAITKRSGLDKRN